MDNEIEWPPLPEIIANDPQAEVKKLAYQAKLDVIKAKRQVELDIHKVQFAANIEREKADWAHEYNIDKAIHDSYLEVAKKEVDRRVARAEFVQKMAAAVSGLYVAVLALSFTIGKEVNRPLPAQGIIPTFFLGMSIVFVTMHFAYVEKPGIISADKPVGILREDQRQRRNTFIRWAVNPSLQRLYFLHTSILSLASGVIFLPAPYIAAQGCLMWIFAGIILVATFLMPVFFRRKTKI